jgi:predicted amidophosphoribosyltransferase
LSEARHSPPKAPSYCLPIGRIGFLVGCCGCGRQFDSHGLRCCSDCERTFRRKQELDAELADDPSVRSTVREARLP